MNKLSAYQKTRNAGLEEEVLNSSPSQLVVLLYDALLDSIRANPGEDLRNPNRPLDIIGELLSTLNHEVFPELTSNLQSLYEFWIKEILLYRIHRDRVHIDNIIPSITILRYTWSEVANEQAVPFLPTE